MFQSRPITINSFWVLDLCSDIISHSFEVFSLHCCKIALGLQLIFDISHFFVFSNVGVELEGWKMMQQADMFAWKYFCRDNAHF